MSEDGQTIVFMTGEALVPGDLNGVQDSYLWREGQLVRLPGTANPAPTSTLRRGNPVISHDGSTVAFQSFSQMLPQDGDTISDIYVARVDGGFPAPAPDKPCDLAGDHCQGGGAGAVTVESKTSPPSDGNAQRHERKRLSVSGLSMRARRTASRTGRVVLSVSTNKAGRVTAVALARIGKRTRQVARQSVAMRDGGTARLTLTLNRAAKRALRSGKALLVTLRVASPEARPRTMTVRLPGVKP